MMTDAAELLTISWDGSWGLKIFQVRRNTELFCFFFYGPPAELVQKKCDLRLIPIRSLNTAFRISWQLFKDLF